MGARHGRQCAGGARGDMSVSRGVGGMSCGMSRHSVSAACPQLVYCGNEPLPPHRAMQINMFCGSETQLLVMQGRGLNQPMGALGARCRPMAGRLVTMVSEQSVAKPNRLVTRCYTSGRAAPPPLLSNHYQCLQPLRPVLFYFRQSIHALLAAN